MDIQSEKAILLKEMERITDESLIRAIQSMIDYSIKRDEEYLGETVDSYNEAIDRAETEINKGNFVSHEEALARISGWRKKEPLSGAK